MDSSGRHDRATLPPGPERASIAPALRPRRRHAAIVVVGIAQTVGAAVLCFLGFMSWLVSTWPKGPMLDERASYEFQIAAVSLFAAIVFVFLGALIVRRAVRRW